MTKFTSPTNISTESSRLDCSFCFSCFSFQHDNGYQSVVLCRQAFAPFAAEASSPSKKRMIVNFRFVYRRPLRRQFPAEFPITRSAVVGSDELNSLNSWCRNGCCDVMLSFRLEVLRLLFEFCFAGGLVCESSTVVQPVLFSSSQYSRFFFFEWLPTCRTRAKLDLSLDVIKSALGVKRSRFVFSHRL